MSGSAVAQAQRNAEIRKAREERSYPLGEHKVVDIGSSFHVCINCNMKRRADNHGRDIFRTTECNY